jgi:hypothetical protein
MVDDKGAPARSGWTGAAGSLPTVDGRRLATGGDTLVVDVTSMNDQNWFDRAGNFHSDALHVVERYTPRSRDALTYEATIEDPKVFSRPWKIGMPLYRRLEKNAQLLEFKCVEFVEELLYGQFRKQPSK